MDWTFLPWIKFNGLQWINVERMRSQSRRSRHFLPGAGAGAGALKTFYLELEPESEQKCFPGAGAGAGTVKKFQGSASLGIRVAIGSVFFLLRLDSDWLPVGLYLTPSPPKWRNNHPLLGTRLPFSAPSAHFKFVFHIRILSGNSTILIKYRRTYLPVDLSPAP